jgi:hypothetical protein
VVDDSMQGAILYYKLEKKTKREKEKRKNERRKNDQPLHEH